VYYTSSGSVNITIETATRQRSKNDGYTQEDKAFNFKEHSTGVQVKESADLH